ncbi:MAG: PilZ domain-containing protein [Treponema sp.]|nr:PilZ domain-containing protein [Treponema sp.]
MGISTSHQISRYYDFFRDNEIVFTKANIQILKMDPRQVYLRLNGGQWPCIINSSSLQKAKIIIGTASGAYTELKKNPSAPVSLRLCFLDSNNAPIHFFVNCTVVEKKAYQNSEELAVLTLEFTQRPPDDLISRLGEFLEANDNFQKRKEDRIELNQNTIRKLGIDREESVILVENVPRKCIIKDLSFGGAKLMLVGIPKFLIDKSVGLRIDFVDTNESVVVAGKIMKAESSEGRKEIAIVHVGFIPELVPMPFKLHINTFITTYQKNMLNNQIPPVQNSGI